MKHRMIGLMIIVMVIAAALPATAERKGWDFGDGEYWIGNYQHVEHAVRNLNNLLYKGLRLPRAALNHGWQNAVSNSMRRFEYAVANFDMLVMIAQGKLSREARAVIADLYAGTNVTMQTTAASAGDLMGNIDMVGDFLGRFSGNMWIADRPVP